MVVRQLFDCEPYIRLSDQGEHDPCTQGVWLQVRSHRQVQPSASKGLLHFQLLVRFFCTILVDFPLYFSNE